jgi:hypothetical protein
MENFYNNGRFQFVQQRKMTEKYVFGRAIATIMRDEENPFHPGVSADVFFRKILGRLLSSMDCSFFGSFMHTISLTS